MGFLFERSRRKNKKLEQAAELYATGKLIFDRKDEDEQVDKHLDDAKELFGLVISKEQLTPDDVFYLWPENVETFNVWLRLRTQWFYDFEGRKTGLNYTSVEQVLKWHQIKGKKKSQMVEELCAMESAEIKILHK